jgi:hypothetical protein
MPRPENITKEHIANWDRIIDRDVSLPSELMKNILLREVCYAGQWLNEELMKLGCSEELVIRIIYTAGGLCFGRDPWEVHQQMLDDFKNNKLEYASDLN